MTVGTKSLLFGVHAFWLHPFVVAIAWIRLYGFPLDIRIWIAFLVHDLGYWGCKSIDGEDGKKHPELGARIMHFLFGEEWRDFVLYHSRGTARRCQASVSRLCLADKLAWTIEPWWMYIPRATMSGEIKEYIASASGHWSTRSKREWYSGLQNHARKTIDDINNGGIGLWCSGE